MFNIVQQGHDDYWLGAMDYDNPYKESSAQYDAWKQGWNEAYKLDAISLMFKL